MYEEKSNYIGRDPCFVGSALNTSVCLAGGDDLCSSFNV